ncbi:MAG: class I SAM-dependent methyltransferase [Akkermansiaceae bacterium]
MEYATNRGRIIIPELLDNLSPDDIRAIQSRRELHWINQLMGNERWILSQLRRHHTTLDQHIVEWGAGDGYLCSKIHQRHPQVQVTGVDLISRPKSLSTKIGWLTGNFLEMKVPTNPKVIVANLFLHHLTDDQLQECVTWFHTASMLIINEPLRKNSSHFWGRLLDPFLGDVTRHDMHASINAGFRKGELSRLWSVIKHEWVIEEWEHWPGAYRSVWRRK